MIRHVLRHTGRSRFPHDAEYALPGGGRHHFFAAISVTIALPSIAIRQRLLKPCVLLSVAFNLLRGSSCGMD